MCEPSMYDNTLEPSTPAPSGAPRGGIMTDPDVETVLARGLAAWLDHYDLGTAEHRASVLELRALLAAALRGASLPEPSGVWADDPDALSEARAHVAQVEAVEGIAAEFRLIAEAPIDGALDRVTWRGAWLAAADRVTDWQEATP